MSSAPGSPCGACKFLRRKCSSDCIFAPYFSSEQGAARFAAIHKVFGASNASKLLLHVPPADRCEAAVTIAFEAQARLLDPVYGCVGRIFALQHQVAGLQMQLMQVKAQIAQRVLSLQSSGSSSQWQVGNSITNFEFNPSMLFQPYSSSSSPSPPSWESCMSSSSSSSSNSQGSCSDYFMISNQGHYSAGVSSAQNGLFKELGSGKKLWATKADMGELQDLAFSMIGNM